MLSKLSSPSKRPAETELLPEPKRARTDTDALGEYFHTALQYERGPRALPRAIALIGEQVLDETAVEQQLFDVGRDETPPSCYSLRAFCNWIAENRERYTFRSGLTATLITVARSEPCMLLIMEYLYATYPVFFQHAPPIRLLQRLIENENNPRRFAVRDPSTCKDEGIMGLVHFAIRHMRANAEAYGFPENPSRFVFHTFLYQYPKWLIALERWEVLPAQLPQTFGDLNSFTECHAVVQVQAMRNIPVKMPRRPAFMNKAQITMCDDLLALAGKGGNHEIRAWALKPAQLLKFYKNYGRHFYNTCKFFDTVPPAALTDLLHQIRRGPLRTKADVMTRLSLTARLHRVYDVPLAKHIDETFPTDDQWDVVEEYWIEHEDCPADGCALPEGLV